MALSLSCRGKDTKTDVFQFKYDVFLSFRGETRYNFTGHLYQALRDKQIETFIDNNLKRGDEISPALVKAIEESQISVIIFSKGYASSRWCLDELVKILECREKKKQMLIPIFYGVDPSDVRHQTGSFEIAFADHQQRFQDDLDKLQRWKDALNQAANISGFDSSVVKSEAVLVSYIVKDVLEKLKDTSPSYNKDLVGINSMINEIEFWLGTGSVGIWGFGGIGKTTLARAVLDKISGQFEGSCFVRNIREASETPDGLDRLQKKLLSTLLGDKIAYIDTFTKRRLGRMKLLIVFDDVTTVEQIEHLIGDVNFCSGSQIIVTSRDKQLLNNCGVDKIYEVKELRFNDALKLFCQHAFRQNRTKVDYKELSNSVVEKVGGVPLALKVLGSALFDKPKEVWKDAMKKLENNFDDKIHKVLKISYGALDYAEKNIFLDIACFFNGWDVDHVKVIMDACGFFGVAGISGLIDKSLITKSGNRLTMHDLLQAMGKEIVRQESINDPGKRSRLWHLSDIYRILTKATGTDKIEGISLDMSTTRDIHLHPRAFANMPDLRFLNFYNSSHCKKNKVHISEVLESVFTELKYLHWYGYPLKSLHSNFHFENLVIFEMPNSNVEELWRGYQHLDKLKRIDLRNSRHLIRCPDLSGAQNLESLRLDWCTNLSEIPECSSLKSLKELNLNRCSKLERIPELPNNLETLDLNDCRSLVEISSSSFKRLKKVKLLVLDDCRSLTGLPDLRGLKSLNVLRISGCQNLKMLPEVPKNITSLSLKSSPIEELPPSFADLDSLKELDLRGCSMLNSLLSSVSNWKSLETLILDNCSKIDKLPDDIGTLQSLQNISADRTAVREVPPSISCLKRLCRLDFSGCKGEDGKGLLLPPLLGFDNLMYLVLSDCGITALPETLGCLTSLLRLWLDGNNFESIPGSIINLSKLDVLDISYCERLRVLPELPASTRFIVANNCKSLEELSYFSFKNKQFKVEASFINCSELDRNILNDVVKNTLQKIQVPTALVKKDYEEPEGVSPCFYMKYPGSEIPECFSYRSRGTFIDVELPPRWLDYNFLCFALCIVVANPDNQYDDDDLDLTVDYECNVKSKDGDRPVETERSSGKPYSLFELPELSPYDIRSNHVIIGFGYHFFRDLCDNQFSFQFYPKPVHENDELNIEFFKLEECGVHLMYGRHLETSEYESGFEESDEEDESDFEESDEEAEPHPKRLKHIE